MKKITLLVAVAAMFVFASCKKDYSCSCTSTSSLAGSTADPAHVTVHKDVKKVQAGAACHNTESAESYTSGGTTTNYTVTTTCTLSKK
ncbi:MAG: hypothetical protein Q8M29_01695 [Bacteroidota bacterium]|nr:hypothetical protein [Bacteroidota bacterium]